MCTLHVSSCFVTFLKKHFLDGSKRYGPRFLPLRWAPRRAVEDGWIFAR